MFTNLVHVWETGQIHDRNYLTHEEKHGKLIVLPKITLNNISNKGSFQASRQNPHCALQCHNIVPILSPECNGCAIK